MPRHITVQLKCRYCGESLIDESHPVDGTPGIKLNVRSGDKSATVWLSAIFGSNNIDSEVQFAKGEIVTFSCPNCSAEQNTGKKCDVCGAPVAMFKISDGGKVRVCCRSGCKNIWLDL
jgi:predicted RNA-binding Zn-ribbon protein involved in translation (DUF1610 family)